jgi:hypothetical protein
MIGRNVDKTKMEVRVRMDDFLTNAYQKFQSAIWSYMKLKDVLEVLPMIMPENFLDLFVFIWGSENCSKTSGEISSKSHYYLKDLKYVYCCLLWIILWERRSNILD